MENAAERPDATPATPTMVLIKTTDGKPVDVFIPAEILVACPLKAFKQRRAMKCQTCEYFRGLRDCAPGNKELAFESRYSVICVAPISRALARLDSSDD